MRKPQTRGVLKRTKILQSAGVLFAQHGYETTTFAMIARASGAAVGSIEHFFGHKPNLAAAVHEDVVARLTAVIEQAIAAHGYDVSGAVRALLPAYFAWAAANPEHQRIMNVLTDYAVEHGPTRAKGLQARIEPLLLALATPMMNGGIVRPLTATQLFAIIMAPAMASARTEAQETGILQGWPSVLTAIVIDAITLPTSQPVLTAHRGPTRKTSPTLPLEDDLFG